MDDYDQPNAAPLDQGPHQEGSNLADDPHKEAALLGLVVVEPGPTELLLDIDSQMAMVTYEANREALNDATQSLWIVETKRIPSRKPGHWHVYCTVELNGTSWDELTAEVRIAFQAILGSDLRREGFSLIRAMFGLNRPPTVFFEKP